ncbi:pyridine nucleotide-disulfide oxidoreductase [Streptomyces regensis]|uniref:NAD/ferredoxin-dependent reductase-like protein n=1 Tax=Prauserella rugosa TaxID=43354 RepID=A0A660C9X0_9PSEU|nr:pyridine nucleotide-disulfide oxidoreductase [Streptomyces regensis]TWH18667.1 NAD/ferredoxin-dependent reductase-like protein [Prauserella rugosa]
MTGLVVVGASLAGLRAVERARKAGYDGSITLIGAEEHLPYDRPPLSKAYLLGESVPDPRFRTEDQLSELDVELVLGTPATGLDTDSREVIAGRRVAYDALVIATGARARTLPGSEQLSGLHVLRTLDDAKELRAALDSAPQHVVVVGAGFIGSEVASAARARGLAVTVVEAAQYPLTRSLGSELGVACSLLHERHGTRLRTGVGVAGLEGNGSVEKVQLTDGTVLEADLVVVGIGASPVVDWLEGSGVAVHDGVVCDETLASSVAGVYAAGDVACWRNPLFGRAMRLEHWTSAAEQGAIAASNALDPGQARSYSTVPYFWSDWYGTRIQFVGVPGSDEHRVVAGSAEDGELVALYREGDRLVGALVLDQPSSTMKYRGLINRRTSWAEALEFARARHGGASL